MHNKDSPLLFLILLLSKMYNFFSQQNMSHDSEEKWFRSKEIKNYIDISRISPMSSVGACILSINQYLMYYRALSMSYPYKILKICC